MPKSTAGARPCEGLTRALSALPGVHRVRMDEPGGVVSLICSPPGGYPPIEAAAHALLSREGVAPGEMQLEISYVGLPQGRERVRFLSLDAERPRPGVLVATARLEWNQRVYAERAEGEGSLAAELRIAAQATLNSLEAVLEGVIGFHLIGVKSIRVFDADLVAVLANCEDDPDRRLVGTAMVADGDPLHSTALAVLNATNRVLGNYLSTSE